MNLLLIDCKKDKDASFRHTVINVGKLNGKTIREIIFDKFFGEIIGPEWVEEFRVNPLAFMQKYHTETQ